MDWWTSRNTALDYLRNTPAIDGGAGWGVPNSVFNKKNRAYS